MFKSKTDDCRVKEARRFEDHLRNFVEVVHHAGSGNWLSLKIRSCLNKQEIEQRIAELENIGTVTVYTN